MQLFFEIIDGDNAGERFEIRAGSTIGRQKSDITLRDSKISSKHAVVEQRENGSYFLLDTGSVNGIKLGKEKVGEVLLTPGVTFRVGRTNLKVIELEPTEALAFRRKVESWSETLERLSIDAVAKFTDGPREISPFNPLLQLKFVQGVQSGVVWTLGYGPRQIGFDVTELRLEEPECPDICFELHALRDGAQFRSEHPDKVKVNGQSIRETPLSNGDLIEIGKTKIEVVFNRDE